MTHTSDIRRAAVRGALVLAALIGATGALTAQAAANQAKPAAAPARQGGTFVKPSDAVLRQKLTPEQYRAKWGLRPEYPMVAPSYSKARSELARALGLGQKAAGQKRKAGKKG